MFEQDLTDQITGNSEHDAESGARQWLLEDAFEVPIGVSAAPEDSELLDSVGAASDGSTDGFSRSGKPKVANAAPLAGIYGAVKGLELLGKTHWSSQNGSQEQLLELHQKLKGDLNKIPAKVVDGLASTDANKLNSFLKDHGYNASFKPLSKNGIGLVTTTELAGEWRGRDAGQIETGGKSYPAFKLKTNEVYNVGGRPVAKIYENRESGIKVFVAPYDGTPRGVDASQIAKDLTPATGSRKAGYDSVRMPKVDMDRSLPLTWMIGLKNSKGQSVEQARVQTQVQMDENGFKAKEAISLLTLKGIDQKTLTLDKPFMFWIMKDDVSYPLFATTIDKQYWKAPPKRK